MIQLLQNLIICYIIGSVVAMLCLLTPIIKREVEEAVKPLDVIFPVIYVKWIFIGFSWFSVLAFLLVYLGDLFLWVGKMRRKIKLLYTIWKAKRLLKRLTKKYNL